MNNEGYDSKGGLPFFADESDDNGDAYIKLLLNNGPPAAPPSSPEPVATMQLRVESVMTLNVTQLKDELKNRGQLCARRKNDLQDHLKEAILNNIPVFSGNEPPCQECTAGLDIMARWELLTPDAQEQRSGPLPPHQDEWVSQGGAAGGPLLSSSLIYASPLSLDSSAKKGSPPLESYPSLFNSEILMWNRFLG